jgi:low affinity Fe/Cu permease
VRCPGRPCLAQRPAETELFSQLDEILRALPAADKSLITLEKAPDRDLRQATKKHRHARHEVQG